MKKRTFTLLFVLLSALTISVQAQTDVSGLVLYHMKPNKPIPSVIMSLTDTAGVVIATDTTELNGTYTFTNVPFGTYTLTGETSISAGGVTMGDAFLMFLHLCNLYTFSPVQEMAADVDGDGTVTWTDYWTVVIGWFVQGYPFPVGPWTFEEVSFTLTGTKTNVPTMGGSSAGDVNGTFVPSTRDLPAINVTYTTRQISDDFEIEIYALDITEASAMGMVINYPDAFVNIGEVSSQLGDPNLAVENGQIRVSWVNQQNSCAVINPGEPILKIKASLKSSYDGNDVRFVIDPTSHFSDYKGELIETRYSLPLITNAGSYLSQNFPNPFCGSTNISYTLPEESRVNISLYNQYGQLVKVLTDGKENAGLHILPFNSQGLDAGVYFYTLNTFGTNPVSETKRLIITR